MRTRPILFNTEMVKAILDGRKTQTRRLMKPQPLFYTGRKYIFADEVITKKWEGCQDIIATYQYQTGDILWVRETWAWFPAMECATPCIGPCKRYKDDYGCFVYRAGNQNQNFTWKPSIHMPREAARIFLRVTDVRIERLQDIDDDGVVAEGLEIGAQFDELWNRTVKNSDRSKFGWEANPWVWVIEFEHCEKP